MEKISVDAESRSSVFEEAVSLEKKVKTKITKSFTNYAGVFIGVFIMFAVVVIVTTDIKLASLEELAALGLDFFLLLFCAYAMYINCSDSGMRSGLLHKDYIDAKARFEEHKKILKDRKLESKLPEFCRHYIEEELKNARMDVLTIVGISYDTYVADYMKLGKRDVDALSLPESQKKAILRANAITPIKLTPEMIMRRGRGSSRKNPLGIKPATKKMLAYSGKFVTTFIVSVLMVLMVFDIIFEPTWAVIASCCIKLLMIVMNGFSGYKLGFENIVFDTVSYIDDQTDLLRQAINFAEAHPSEI